MTPTNPVPWLRSGVGRNPQDGGCILQVIDWVDRHQWTDSPPCVHPVLRKLAIYVNDRADDEQRQRLLELAPRLMGTASDDPRLAVLLAAFCARQVLHIFEDRYPGDDRPRKAIEAAESGNASAASADAAHDAAYDAAAHAAAHAASGAAYAHAAAHAASAAAYAAAAASAAASWRLLLNTLDEHDRLTSRTTHHPVNLTPAAEAMRA
jgi:hypothetical protein